MISAVRTLGRIVVHQLLEHLLPAVELYIYKSVCVVQIAAIHTEKCFDALVELRLIMVQEGDCDKKSVNVDLL